MSGHIFLIDPLEKLVPTKDSTLMLALSMMDRGIEVYLLFEKDFYFANTDKTPLKVFTFSGAFEESGAYLKNFSLEGEKWIEPGDQHTFHMRLDPPFDSRYLRYLWMFKSMKELRGIKVINSPEGIMLHNEKLLAYEEKDSLKSFVGSGEVEFLKYLEQVECQDLILKPMDLYQGIGVEKVSRHDETKLIEAFNRKVEEFKGPVIAQPFVKAVESGEIRASFFAGVELGSILKIPPKGDFLANIAQGATFEATTLNKVQLERCKGICERLMRYDVPWVAFDILGDQISEVNVTCPGLLVEVSKAKNKNLALDIIKLLK